MKIKLSWIWLPYFCLIQYVPIGKTITYIFLILTIHEVSHILFAYLFHYQVECVRIYPFGLAAQIPDVGKGHIVQEMVILAAGPLSHLCIPYVFKIFVSLQWISLPYYEYLCSISTAMMIFNLVPIYPLDGGRIMQSILHCIFRYQRANLITYLFSYLVLAILFLSGKLQGISAWLLLFFIGLQLGIAIRDRSLTTLQFYYYRWKHPVTYPPIRNKQKDLFRYRYNIMKIQSGWTLEEHWIDQLFKNSSFPQ